MPLFRTQARMSAGLESGWSAHSDRCGRHNEPVTLGIRRVGADLLFEAQQPVTAVLQVAVSSTVAVGVDEELHVSCQGVPLDANEVTMPGGERVHVVKAPPGRIAVHYRATVLGGAAPPSLSEADRVLYLRPSRYAESDRLAAIARAEFAGVQGGAQLLAAVSSWVGSQLEYVPGSSGPTDGAVDTLLRRQGVCRDFAHLVIALLRALDVPARIAAVYAPGLQPMDFHAVAEAVVGREWRVVDATLLAPRASLVRISTGRDATDTAFLSTYGATATLLESEVTAIVDGPLPVEEVTALLSMG
jgi:transglutaminase-like putative cysteine protease